MSSSSSSVVMLPQARLSFACGRLEESALVVFVGCVAGIKKLLFSGTGTALPVVVLTDVQELFDCSSFFDSVRDLI